MSLLLVKLVRKTSGQKGASFQLQVMYADIANDCGKSIYAGIDYVAKMCRIDRRTAQRMTRHLESINWLQLVGNEHGGRNPGTNQGLARQYQINPQWIQLATPHAQTIGRGEHIKVLAWYTRGGGVASLDGGILCPDSDATPPQQYLTLKQAMLVENAKSQFSTTHNVELDMCESCYFEYAKMNLPGRKTRVCFRCWQEETGREAP
jgi:hypothetical protein